MWFYNFKKSIFIYTNILKKSKLQKVKKNLFLNTVLTVTNLDVNFCKHFITQNLEIKVL